MDPLPRPTSVLVVSIVCLVFAALGLCGVVMAVPILRLDPAALPDNPAYKAYEHCPGFLTYTKIAVVVGVLASLVLATAGVGMLTARAWGRAVALGWAAYSIVSGVLGVILNTTIYFPALDKVIEKEGTMISGAAKMGAAGGLFGATCLGVGWPLVMVFLLTRPPVAEYFRSLTAPPEA
jgi:hypothetical protein